jgi:pSer/pThr/pTyr-binding forkhead associated (FHA) protein
MLYVQSGPRAGTDYRLNVGNSTIGRNSSNDICIDHPEVSGEHALIREEGGRFTLHDRGSTNGTSLNGQMVRSPMMLEDGDEIDLAQVVVLSFRVFS